MTNIWPADWSPADNPYTIAVSESQWWLRAVILAILRIRDGDERRASSFSSRQIDARQLIFALRQLLTAEQLEQAALKELDIDPAVGDALAQARKRFEDALPGVKHMRDALIHFDEWSRGEGKGKYGPQHERRQAGEALRDVARTYWGFAYYPTTDTISLGPYAIQVEVAGRSARELCHAIYLAAHEVDKKNTADLRARTAQALTSAGIRCDSPEAVLKVSPGHDLRIWLSLNIEAVPTEHKRHELSARVVAALTTAGLSLRSSEQRPAEDAAGPLARGEALRVEPDAPTATEQPQ